MIAFQRLPGVTDRRAWPLLDVRLGDGGGVPHTCLVDSGATGVRLSAELGRAAGVLLPEEPNGPDVIAAGTRSQTFRVRMPLAVDLGKARVTWVAPVAFCDPWPHPFGLLGQEGFFDAFDVLLQAREGRFACTPRGDSP